MLVDVETGRPVDLLPDRAADTLAAWLTEHPGVEIVCRDRYSAFSEATKRAAPDAISPDALLELIEPVPPASDPPDSQILARVRQRHKDIHDRLLRGDNHSAISRDLRLDRKTVRRYANIELDDLLASAGDRRPEILARFKPYIQQRYRTGGTNATQLFREVLTSHVTWVPMGRSSTVAAHASRARPALEPSGQEYSIMGRSCQSGVT